MNPAVALDNAIRSSLATFPAFHGSYGIVPNGPAGSVVTFNICQGLTRKHVASTPTSNMWLSCSNCALPWTTKFLGCILKDRYYVIPVVFSPGPKTLCWIFQQNVYILKIPSWVSGGLALFMLSSYLSLTYYLLESELYHCLCVLPFTLVLLVFIVLNSNYFSHIQICLKPI